MDETSKNQALNPKRQISNAKSQTSLFDPGQLFVYSLVIKNTCYTRERILNGYLEPFLSESRNSNQFRLPYVLSERKGVYGTY